MGCNTSKDSVPQKESENKESQQAPAETTEGKSPDNKSLGGEHHANNETNDTKSASAKTITLRSNGTTKSVEEAVSVEKNTVQEVKDVTDPPKDSKDLEADEEEAATKIQAAFRGHKTRQSMKQPANKVAQAEPEPTREQLEEEFRLDDEELCHAATKIQASFRGHMTRKHEADAKKSESSSSQNKNKEKAQEEELDIDLSDPDLNKAAVKIQASFRGHMVRKDNEGETPAN